MAKKNEEIEVYTTSVVNVQKGLSYTRDQYIALVTSTKEALDQAIEADADKKAVAELFGIYYCGLSGLIRAGSLCKRVMGQDGFPVIEVTAGDKTFSCRESVLHGILQDEAPELIKPFADTAESYVDVSAANTTFLSSITDEAIEAYLESIANKKKRGSWFGARDKKKVAVAEKYAEIVKENGGDDTVPPENPVPYFEAVPAPAPEVDALKEEYEEILNAVNGGSDLNKMVLDLQAELMSISNQLDAANTEITEMHAKAEATGQREAPEKTRDKEDALRNEIKRKDEAFSEFKRQVDTEREERERYVYEPNYDQYYNEILPSLIESMNVSKKSIFIKSVCVATCCLAIAASFVFIL